MTPVIVKTLVALTALIYLENMLWSATGGDRRDNGSTLANQYADVAQRYTQQGCQNSPESSERRACLRIESIGTSSGGVDALRSSQADYQAEFASPISRSSSTSHQCAGTCIRFSRKRARLPAFKVVSGMPLRASGVYVAPPDFHLMVDKGTVRVTKGPRENRFRPAIDPLFRSAAYSYGPSACCDSASRPRTRVRTATACCSR